MMHESVDFFIRYHFPENWVSFLDIANLGNLKVISLKKSSIKEIYNKGFCLGPQKLTYLYVVWYSQQPKPLFGLGPEPIVKQKMVAIF